MSNEMCVQKRKAPITHHHLLFRYFYDFALFCATYRAISQRKFNRQLWVIFLAYSVLDNPALSFLAASHMSSSRYGTRHLLSKLIVLSRRPINIRGQVSMNKCHAPSRWRYNGVGAELAESLVPWLQKALLILMDNYSWITTMSFYVQRMQICGFLCYALV